MSTQKTLRTLKLKWTGTRPLVMSNPQTVNIANRYAIESRRIGALVKSARKKGDEDRLVELEVEQRKNDFCASAYFDGNGFFLPDTVILACLKESARTLKKGKDIDRAVIMLETEAAIATGRKFTTTEKAFEDAAYRLECPCKIPPRTGALIWKCRCKMPTGWACEFTLEFSPDIIAESTLIEIAATAGEMIGIGGWRPKFGRFKSEVLN